MEKREDNNHCDMCVSLHAVCEPVGLRGVREPKRYPWSNNELWSDNQAHGETDEFKRFAGASHFKRQNIGIYSTSDRTPTHQGKDLHLDGLHGPHILSGFTTFL